MSEDSQNPRRDKPEQGDKFIPPPMDPYATYQTPYERRKSPEPNPFIEFRRFADKQLSDIFSDISSGISHFANFPKILGLDEEMKTFREQVEKDFKEFKDVMARQEAMEQHSKSLGNNPYRPIPPSATAALLPSSSRINDRSIEESVSEHKQKSAPDFSRGWVTTTDDNGKKYRINLSTGNAIEEPAATPSTSKVQQQDDPKTRWRRGFRNCPELKKYRGETELDVYEALEDQQRPSKSAEPSTPESPSWSSWLSAYGYDGLQQSKKSIEPTASASTRTRPEESLAPSCIIRQVRARQTVPVDPFANDDDFLPWITLNPYSPLLLENPDQPRLKSVSLHNGCRDGCSRPMKTWNHKYIYLGEEDSKLKETLASKVAWTDAFEDLISLDRTGQMPYRNFKERAHSKSVTKGWVHDMVEKGSLGPRWWVENGEIKRDSRHDPKPWAGKDEEAGVKEMDALTPVLMTQLLEARQHLSKDLFDNSRAVQPSEETNKTSQHTPPVDHFPKVQPEAPATNTTSSQPPSTNLEVSSVPVQPKQESAQPPTPKSSVISTMTTTRTRTLPDGSIETKRVLKQRFADGNEESEESTEIIHPKAPVLESTTGTKQEKQGWFWT